MCISIPRWHLWFELKEHQMFRKLRNNLKIVRSLRTVSNCFFFTSFYRSRFPQKLFFPILRKSHSNNINIWIFFQQNIYLIAESNRWIDNVQEIVNHTKNKIYVLSSFSWQCNKRKSRPPWHHWGYTKRLVP